MKKTKEYVFNVKCLPKFYGGADGLTKLRYAASGDTETSEITVYQENAYRIGRIGESYSYELHISGDIADINVIISKSELADLKKMINKILTKI